MKDSANKGKGKKAGKADKKNKIKTKGKLEDNVKQQMAE